MFDGVEELVALFRFSNVGVDEERVDFRVNVLPAHATSVSDRSDPIERGAYIMIWKP